MLLMSKIRGCCKAEISKADKLEGKEFGMNFSSVAIAIISGSQGNINFFVKKVYGVRFLEISQS